MMDAGGKMGFPPQKRCDVQGNEETRDRGACARGADSACLVCSLYCQSCWIKSSRDSAVKEGKTKSSFTFWCNFRGTVIVIVPLFKVKFL